MPSGLLQPRTGTKLLTIAAATAALQILAVLASLWVVLHYIQTHIAKQPLVVLLFPPLAMGSIALVIPLMMFISYQADFPGMNPANPAHFLHISRRCYRALGSNNLKVSEKDL